MSDEHDLGDPTFSPSAPSGPVGERVFLLQCEQGTQPSPSRSRRARWPSWPATWPASCASWAAPASLPEDLGLRRRRGARLDGGHHRRLLRRGDRPARGGRRGAGGGRRGGRGGPHRPSPASRRPPSPSGPPSWSRPGGRRAPCAGCPSTPRATTAPGRTATAPRSREPADPDRAGPRGPAQAPGGRRSVHRSSSGEMTVHGRIAGSSNATLLVTCRLDGHRVPGRLQAGPGRAAAVGLPLGAAPARGRRLRGVRGPRLGSRSRDGPAPRGPLRARLGPALRPRGRESHYFTLLEDPAWRGDLRRARRLRRGGQQRRPQERPRPAGRGAVCGPSTTG